MTLDDIEELCEDCGDVIELGEMRNAHVCVGCGLLMHGECGMGRQDTDLGWCEDCFDEQATHTELPGKVAQA